MSKIRRCDALRGITDLVTEGLPAPRGITFIEGQYICILDLAFDDLSAGQAWAPRLGITPRIETHSDERRWLGHAPMFWRGWSIQLHAWDCPDGAS
jgi:hypothetical protein